jgi:hypothetical protein
MSDPTPTADATTSHSTAPRADFLIKTLGLTYLPKESGYIGILGRSCHTVTLAPTAPDTGVAKIPASLHSSKTLAAQSHNYYMLTAKYPVNFLHFLETLGYAVQPIHNSETGIAGAPPSMANHSRISGSNCPLPSASAFLWACTVSL